MSKLNQSETKSTTSLHSARNNQNVLSRFSLSILGIVSVFALGSITQAAEEASIPMLRNATTGKTLLHDDFESYTVPDSPAVLLKPASSENMTGSWEGGMVFNPFGTLDLGIVNKSRSMSGKVVPNQGKQFLMMSGQVGDPVGQTWTIKGHDAQSGDGDILVANISFFLTSGSNRALIYFYGGFYQNQLLAALSLNGENPLHRKYSVATNDGEEFKQTPLRFEPDVWNTLTVTHTNGTADWEVSINGGKAIKIDSFLGESPHYLNTLFFNQTTDSARGTTVYFDAVASSSSPKGNRR